MCNQFRRAFKASWPVAFGYIPSGIGYGLLVAGLGLHWSFALISSIVILAGSAQFFSIGLLASGALFSDILLATLAINIRHIFYGFPFLLRYDSAPLFKKFYLVFGLTDETFSILSGQKQKTEKEDHHFCLLVTAFNHFYWVLGSVLGALAASFIAVPSGRIGFIMTALFTVLAVEQAYAVKRVKPFIIAGVALILSVAFMGKDFLMLSLSLSFGLIVAGYYLKGIRLKGKARVR